MGTILAFVLGVICGQLLTWATQAAAERELERMRREQEQSAPW